MRVAYADPPYLGQAKKHYGPNAEEVNHELLISHLMEYDAWALSCSSPSLKVLLPMCPPEARVGAWVKPFAIYKPNVNPGYCWEPVIFYGARKRDRSAETVRDFVSANITLKKGTAGAKPEAFSFWLFDLLGLQPDDEFHDLFPGSNAVMNAWNVWAAPRELRRGE